MPNSEQRVLDGRVEPVGDELLERVDVVRQARDQPAGAVALEVAELERLDVREEVAAEVGEHALADPGREVRLRDSRRPSRAAPRRRTRPSRRAARGGRRGTMPRSIASFAANGDGEPVAVPTSSATADRIALPRYGRTSVNSRPRRWNVRRHENFVPSGASTPIGRMRDAHETRLRGRVLVERDERAVDEAVAPDLGVDRVRVDELRRACRARRRARPRARRSRRPARSSRAGAR